MVPYSSRGFPQKGLDPSASGRDMWLLFQVSLPFLLPELVEPLLLTSFLKLYLLLGPFVCLSFSVPG